MKATKTRELECFVDALREMLGLAPLYYQGRHYAVDSGLPSRPDFTPVEMGAPDEIDVMLSLNDVAAAPRIRRDRKHVTSAMLKKRAAVAPSLSEVQAGATKVSAAPPAQRQ